MDLQQYADQTRKMLVQSDAGENMDMNTLLIVLLVLLVLGGGGFYYRRRV